jgi:hypothetical protein
VGGLVDPLLVFAIKSRQRDGQPLQGLPGFLPAMFQDRWQTHQDVRGIHRGKSRFPLVTSF